MQKEMCQTNQNDKSINQAFEMFDLNKDGEIDLADLRKVAESLGEDIDDNELKEIIETGKNFQKESTNKFDKNALQMFIQKAQEDD